MRETKILKKEIFIAQRDMRIQRILILLVFFPERIRKVF